MVPSLVLVKLAPGPEDWMLMVLKLPDLACNWFETKTSNFLLNFLANCEARTPKTSPLKSSFGQFKLRIKSLELFLFRWMIRTWFPTSGLILTLETSDNGTFKATLNFLPISSFKIWSGKITRPLSVIWNFFRQIRVSLGYSVEI